MVQKFRYLNKMNIAMYMNTEPEIDVNTISWLQNPNFFLYLKWCKLWLIVGTDNLGCDAFLKKREKNQIKKLKSAKSPNLPTPLSLPFVPPALPTFLISVNVLTPSSSPVPKERLKHYFLCVGVVWVTDFKGNAGQTFPSKARDTQFY